MLGLEVKDYVQLAGFILGGLSFILAMRADVKQLAREITLQNIKIDNQTLQLNKIEAVMVKQATLDEKQASLDMRITMLDKRIDEIRHGEGFVIAREYSSR